MTDQESGKHVSSPNLKKTKLERFDWNCRLARLIAWSMLAFATAALVVSRMLDNGVFFEFPSLLLIGAFMLMFYRFFELASFLHEKGVPLKWAIFTIQPVGPIPKLIRRMGEGGVLIAFGIALLVSPLLASKFMDAAGAASPIINYFGIALTAYMYCALIALLVLSGTMRLEGFSAGGEKFVQNALWKDGFFGIACVGLIVVNIALAVM